MWVCVGVYVRAFVCVRTLLLGVCCPDSYVCCSAYWESRCRVSEVKAMLSCQSQLMQHELSAGVESTPTHHQSK